VGGAERLSPLRLFPLITAAVLAAAAVLLPTAPARAFCIDNRTDQRLFFLARLQGTDILPFRRWIDAGTTVCAEPESGQAVIEVFTFVDDAAVEGCDADVAAAATLRLAAFVEFDNCTWE